MWISFLRMTLFLLSFSITCFFRFQRSLAAVRGSDTPSRSYTMGSVNPENPALLINVVRSKLLEDCIGIFSEVSLDRWIHTPRFIKGMKNVTQFFPYKCFLDATPWWETKPLRSSFLEELWKFEIKIFPNSIFLTEMMKFWKIPPNVITKQILEGYNLKFLINILYILSRTWATIHSGVFV